MNRNTARLAAKGHKMTDSELVAQRARHEAQAAAVAKWRIAVSSTDTVKLARIGAYLGNMEARFVAAVAKDLAK